MSAAGRLRGGLFLAGKGMAGLGVGAAALAVTAGPKLLDMGVRIEAMGTKARTVFGGSLPIVQKWADTASAKMGLTSKEAQGLAAGLGDLLTPMGFTQRQAASMSTKIADLSGAFAQWSNGTMSTTDASNMLSDALTGQYDSLKSVGVQLDAATVQELLHKEGKDKLTGAALKQATAEVVLKEITRQSSNAIDGYTKGNNKLADAKNKLISKVNTLKERLVTALIPALTTAATWLGDHLPGALETAGRWAKTAGSWMHEHLIPPLKTLWHWVQEKAVPALENLWRKVEDSVIPALVKFKDDAVPAVKDLVNWIGNHLMPWVKTLVTWIVTKLVPAIAGFVDWLVRNRDWLKYVAGAVLGVVAALKLWDLWNRAVMVSQGLLNVVVGASPVGRVARAVGLLAAAILIARDHSDWFRGATDLDTSAKNRNIIALRKVWSELQAVGRGLAAAGRAFLGSIGYGQRVVNWFRQLPGWFTRIGGDIIHGLFAGMQAAMRGVGSILSGIKDGIVGGLKGLFHIGSPSRVMMDLGGHIITGLIKGMLLHSGALSRTVKDIGGTVTGVFGDVLGRVAGGVPSGFGAVQSMVKGYAQMFFGWSGAQWEALNKLVMRESGYNPNAQNPTSTAYGIGQFLNSTWATVGASKTSNPNVQALAMLRYIKQSYGTPADAWNHEMMAGWYDQGGWLEPGVTLAVNATGRRERILAPGEQGGRLVLEINSGGSKLDDLLVEVLRKAVRVRGGNVQLALGG